MKNMKNLLERGDKKAPVHLAPSVKIARYHWSPKSQTRPAMRAIQATFGQVHEIFHFRQNKTSKSHYEERLKKKGGQKCNHLIINLSNLKRFEVIED